MWRNSCSGYRSFHISAVFNASIGKTMKKVLGNHTKKKKLFTECGVLPSAEMFSKGNFEGKGKGSGNPKRVSVLNKLFMKHITDLLATGEYSSEFVGLGIEINRVQVSHDYKFLNLFWAAKGTQTDEVVEKILKKNAGYLRHELSSLRVIGNVPQITFVKDKQYSQIMELDLKLGIADYGEDHIPVEMATKLKTELELITNLPPHIRNQIQSLENEMSPLEEDEEFVLPMPHNVLGLDHSDVINRIKRSLKKSEAQHRLQPEEVEIAHPVNQSTIEFSSNKDQRAAFRKFLVERELLRSRERKLEKNYFPDIEYMKQEFEERRAEYFKNLDVYQEENDFTDEIDEHVK